MTNQQRIIGELLKRANVTENLAPSTWQHIRRNFSGEELELWLEHLQELLDSGASSDHILNFVRASTAIAQQVGPSPALALGPTSILILRLAGPAALNSMLAHVPRAASLLKHGDALQFWFSCLRELAENAPAGVKPVCDRTDTLLSQLDIHGFRSWLVAGISGASENPDRQIGYFSLRDASSVQVFEQESSDVRLSFLERKLQLLVTGLWGIAPVIRPAIVKKALHIPRRTSFDGHLVRMPETFAGYRAKDGEALFKAAIAHVGAHIVFTLEKFPVRSLKPIQVAIISLLEDARVEALAGRQYPGLLRLWRRFHVAEPSGPNLAGPLMARLSRALIDPDYDDHNPWIQKARKLFKAAGPDWADPEEIRRIGVMLGNDLGQMRVQFNSKTYVVQPPYRDDNVGIWDFGPQPPETTDDPDVVHHSVRIEKTEDLDQPHQRERNEARRDEANLAGRVKLVEADSGVPVARYAEWDYASAQQRPEWVTVVEYQPQQSRPEIINHVLGQHADIEHRISALVSQAKVSRPVRIKRRPEGDRLDIEACIRAFIDRRAGLVPEARVYESSALRQRDLSILVLLDISESTKDTIRGTATSVYSVERAATALMAEAMAGIGDPFAIHAFCSNGRNDVRYYRIKDFDQSYGALSKGRLAGLKPGYSTRMGAALRHAGAEISGQLAYRRLVLVVSDGEPSDVDVADQKYLVEDARKAVHDLGHNGIDVFCVALDSGGDEYLSRIFGRRNVVQIDKIESLPERLPMLYLRLTA